jgi:hypothetical protein
MTLSEPQKKYLRGLGHALKPIVMVGDAGVSASVVAELDACLEHHELVKIRVKVGDRRCNARPADWQHGTPVPGESGSQEDPFAVIARWGGLPQQVDTCEASEDVSSTEVKRSEASHEGEDYRARRSSLLPAGAASTAQM